MVCVRVGVGDAVGPGVNIVKVNDGEGDLVNVDEALVVGAGVSLYG